MCCLSVSLTSLCRLGFLNRCLGGGDGAAELGLPSSSSPPLPGNESGVAGLDVVASTAKADEEVGTSQPSSSSFSSPGGGGGAAGDGGRGGGGSSEIERRRLVPHRR